MENKFTYLKNGSMKYEGILKDEFDFVNKEQLLRKDVWKEFVEVFIEHPDSEDTYWRGEYWGKMMRGACLCYQYENDENLYKVLEETVMDLLATQDEYGRFSSYKKEKEFLSWDVWGRKYVTTSLIHFYHICHSEELKNRIIVALEKHIDYIITHVGKEEGKMPITETSEWWLGVNSCSILEPVMGLYRISKEKRFLDFAKYIVETGGVREGNLIECAREGKLLPYQYPEAKAYETMSFFEGVLDYAMVTNNEELKNVCLKFYEDVYESEISIIGNAGSFEENFSYSKINQVNKPERYSQETCVSVTWMRVLTKLLLLTGEQKYYDRFEITARNAFLGSLNIYHQSAWDFWGKKTLSYLPFDSYAPLRNEKRGVSTGGLCYLSNGHHYGCCACIGSASVGLSAINTVLKDGKTIVINDFYTGKISDEGTTINIKETLTENGKASLSIKCDKDTDFKIRIPSWANKPCVEINGKKIDCKVGEYLSVKLNKGETTIALCFHPELKKHEIGNYEAYTYGPITLAIEEEINPRLDLDSLKSSDLKDLKLESAYNKDSQLLFTATLKGEKVYLRDYASSGKHWDLPKARLTVWMDK